MDPGSSCFHDMSTRPGPLHVGVWDALPETREQGISSARLNLFSAGVQAERSLSTYLPVPVGRGHGAQLSLGPGTGGAEPHWAPLEARMGSSWAGLAVREGLALRFTSLSDPGTAVPVSGLGICKVKMGIFPAPHRLL